jgi:hypothetical protein
MNLLALVDELANGCGIFDWRPQENVCGKN